MAPHAIGDHGGGGPPRDAPRDRPHVKPRRPPENRNRPEPKSADRQDSVGSRCRVIAVRESAGREIGTGRNRNISRPAGFLSKGFAGDRPSSPPADRPADIGLPDANPESALKIVIPTLAAGRRPVPSGWARAGRGRQQGPPHPHCRTLSLASLAAAAALLCVTCRNKKLRAPPITLRPHGLRANRGPRGGVSSIATPPMRTGVGSTLG